MSKTKYFIRIKTKDSVGLFDYLIECNIEHSHISDDSVNGSPTIVVSAQLDREEATAVRLKFPLIGLFNFNKTFKKPVEQ